MRPDAQNAMRTALALGPDYCPPDLFVGSVASIVHGLKAHANAIAHARCFALEETFPRTRAMMGPEAFHAVVEAHLADPGVCGLTLAHIGHGFALQLRGAERDLAAVEIAWLDSHGSMDAPSFDLPALAGLDAAAIASARVSLHPACRIVELGHSADFSWDGFAITSDAALITRPHAEAVLTGVDTAVTSMFHLLDRPRLLGDLLDIDQVAATVLVSSGALALSPAIAL